jgi:hypothetical protein
MILWRALPAWLFRAWPVLALLPAFAIHLLAIRQFPEHASLVNKVAGMLLQLTGGSLILYSINDNLGLFRQKSLLTTIQEWFHAFPRAGKSVTVNVRGAASVGFFGTATAASRKAPVTLEERVAHLEESLKSVRQELATTTSAIHTRIEETKTELGTRISVTTDHMAELRRKVEHAAVGGFKVQAFGVLLAVYGAVTSVFA